MPLQLLRNPLFLASLCALLTLLLSAGIFQRQQTNLIEQANDDYGNALARLAASQATDATLNHDLVSLQVTVHDVASNPQVLSTTIHDVENQLLVQAGSSNAARGLMGALSRAYRAPITFQDSVAGYVTVTLQTRALLEQQDDAWLIGLSGLYITLLILSLLSLRRQGEGPTAASAAPAAVEPDEDQSGALAGRIPAHDGDIVVQLKLHCLNLSSLQQSLSSSLLEKLQQQLARDMSGINTLYSGHIHRASRQGIDLYFRGDELDNTVFRAVCAALLLFHLLENSSNSGVRLHYAAAVFQVPDAPGLQQHIEFCHFQQRCENTLREQGQDKLLLLEHSCATTEVAQRLHIDEQQFADSWLQVQYLQPAYSGLLQKQGAQLAKLNQEASPR